MVRLFWPFELTADKFVMIVDVVLVIGMATTAAAFVVASNIGINFSVEMCVEFKRIFGIMRFSFGFSRREFVRKCIYLW